MQILGPVFRGLIYGLAGDVGLSDALGHPDLEPEGGEGAGTLTGRQAFLLDQQTPPGPHISRRAKEPELCPSARFIT